MLTGLILTDTYRLASMLCDTHDRVVNAISSYVSACASFICWHVVDISDELYDGTDKTDWRTFASALNDFYIGLGLSDSSYCPLFILGGDDIVPMPKIANPLIGAGNEHLYSDMAYCFDLSTGEVRLEDFISLMPRFAVGRLPLLKEWGVDGLAAYLNESVDLAIDGIPISGAAMTTTQSWLRASNEMMRDIPTALLSEDYVPLNNRMIVSPELDTQYEEMYAGYVHELKKIDFLVCNLHGDKSYETPFFIGEDNAHERYTVATQPQMMSESAPYIFNTVACYGARYIGYNLEESMMMTALSYGTMLYCGACDVALGGPDMEGCSELLMKLYNIYLHKGIPAGLALIKAKQDYFRTCHNGDEDERAMFTILEFNLFGCPILSMQPKIAFDYRAILLGNPTDEHSKVRYRPKTVEVVAGWAHRADDIHTYVRDLVDNNLSIIRQKVETEVYQRLGLSKDNLQQVMRVSQDNRSLGYQFLYARSPKQSYSKRGFSMFYIVDTDNEGEITKIIHTK